MPVAYDSSENGALDLCIGMLADSATWRGLLTPVATTTDEAKARVIESDGGMDPSEGEACTNMLGDEIVAAAPLAVVHSDEFPAEEIALGVERRSGQFRVRLFLPRTGADTAPEHFRRARNTGGAIRAEMVARFRTAGYLAAGSIAFEGPFLADDTGAWRDVIVVDLVVTWRG